MDALIASLSDLLPNALDADHTRVEKDRLCDKCQRALKCSKLLRQWLDRQSVSGPETIAHSTVKDLSRSARAGCHLCNLIFAEVDRDGRPERTSLTHNSRVELKLTERAGTVHMGIEVLGLPARARQHRGYSYGSLLIARQADPGDAEQQWHSASRVEEQEGECALTTIRMLSSLHQTTSSSKDLARGWLRQCLAHHDQCSHVVTLDRVLPSRLLHIKQSARDVQVRLTLHSEIPGHSYYIALSHCWGGVQPLQLTSESMNGLRHGIDMYELPKTFYDAVRVTMALRCEYLWIDSLCIIQDSREDWLRESVTMGSVYQNSLCTIAALGARNCHEGLFSFRKQSPLALHGCKYSPDGQRYLHVRHGSQKAPDYILQGKDAAPLHQRAWVIQERILARRTLFFGSSMVSWECLEHSTCEFPERFSSPHIQSFHDNAKCARSALTATPFARERGWGQLDTWLSLVEDYSGCGLTRTEDKLVAISGLIKLIEVQSGKTNVAGLWEEALVRCLLWTPKSTFGNRLIFGFPSWSWASLEGAVNYRVLHRGMLALQTFDDAMHADWEVDVIEVSNTTLVLCGYLVKAEEVIGWPRVNMRAAEDLDRWCGGLIYDLDEHDEDGSWCIPLHSRYLDENSLAGPPWVTGLVVQALDASNTCWKRCGLFEIEVDDCRTSPRFCDWMANKGHQKQRIHLV